MAKGGTMQVEKKRLFVVEDDKSVSRALKILLQGHGFNVDTFLSSEDFFNAVQNTETGALILDIMLPGLDGWEMQQRLFKFGFKLPVIFMSANKDIKGTRRAQLRGAVGFLQKPFNDKELVAMINRAFMPEVPKVYQLL
jgi:FixJ family two-component response regulator